jgi:hypothetical protein
MPEPAYSAYQEQQAYKPANTNDAVEQHAGAHCSRSAALQVVKETGITAG